MLTILAIVTFVAMSFWHFILGIGMFAILFAPDKTSSQLIVTQKDVVIFGGCFAAWMASGVYLFGVW